MIPPPSLLLLLLLLVLLLVLLLALLRCRFGVVVGAVALDSFQGWA